MPITITPAQYLVFEAQQLRHFAAEAARTLAPIVAGRQAATVQDATDQFALEQMRLAERHGLKRKNEMMA